MENTMFRKMPFILAILILLVISLEPIIPLDLKRGLYSVSLTIKEFIIFLLPFIIFGLLFKSVIALSNKATKIIGLILAFVCCSNFLSTFFSHYVGILVYQFDLSMISPHNSEGLQSYWAFQLPKLVSNDKAMFGGILLGILSARVFPIKVMSLIPKIDFLVAKVFQMFLVLIPLFVTGFIVKLQYDGVMQVIVKDYTAIFLSIALAQLSYLALLYFVGSKGNVQNFGTNIRNMIPAAISGFSTMSSAASMPLTIIGVEANAKNQVIARSIVPVTVNIHLVGDCFAIPIFAYAVLKSFGMPDPSLSTFLIFAVYFVLAKFSVAAVPGGGILVMLPILETYLGFNAEMMSLITALYILFDPVITCINVLGNGAFAKLMDNWMAFFEKEDRVAPLPQQEQLNEGALHPSLENPKLASLEKNR
jgi:Na+/H+-dicarboxylate symporter